VSRQLPSQAVYELFDFLEDVVFILPDTIAKALGAMPTARAMAWAEEQVRLALQGRLETKGR